MTWKQRLVIFALGNLFAIVVAFPPLLFVITRPSLAVLRTWNQDPSIQYGSFDPYHLTIFESGTNWRGFPLFLRSSYSIYVGKDPGTPTYGHEMPFEFHGIDTVEAQVEQCTVIWTQDGVELSSPSGHRLVIPKQMFIGGR